MARPMAVLLASLLTLPGAAQTQERALGPYLPEHVWPTSGTSTRDFPLSSTFGPRLKASEACRYDFHRGIDIPVPCDTPVRAIADGTVRLPGDYDSHTDRLVQIRHDKPEGGKYSTTTRTVAWRRWTARPTT